jgi:hypothetical protein
MSDLREYEVFDRLATSFREAAEHCEALAVQINRVKGQRYVKLREHLMLIEGASRQAAFYRGDSRWFQIGQFAAECHKKCGDWLRFKTRGPMFQKCAENMRMMERAAEQMRDRATGVRGDILPPQPKYEPENRSVPVRTPGGIILPAGATLQ